MTMYTNISKFNDILACYYLIPFTFSDVEKYVNLLKSQLHRIEIKNNNKISKNRQKCNKLKRICEKKEMKIMTLKKTVAELEGKNFARWCTSHWYCLLLTRFSVKVNSMHTKMFLAHFTTGSYWEKALICKCLLTGTKHKSAEEVN